MTTTKATSRPSYAVVFRPEPDPSDPDGIRRLRAFLKNAKRRWGLRCVEAHPALEGEGRDDRE